ncbi:MAG: glycosyltransferase [Candidatus Bathyarchaeota archaeon]|nr:glycosyltransferase [Candidatus Bathyarchaeota archaeon]
MVFEGFFQWLGSLTIWDFILIFWLFLLVDAARTIGKPIILLLHKPFEKKPNAVSIYRPKISIIIPAHNEEAVIVKSIKSALDADYPNKEVIVVDDGSKDRTYQLASFFAANGSIKLVHREKSSGSKAMALNYGILFASGDVLVMVDADTLIAHDALNKLVATLDEPDVSAASGNVRILGGDRGKRNLLVRLQEYEYFVAFDLGRRFSSLIGTMIIISGAFGAFQSKELKTLGRYDKDTITEDFDLTIKLRKLHKKLVYVDDAVSYTIAPDSWRAWRTQRIRWTYGEAETIWKHRNLFRRKGFERRSVLALYDMLFNDVVLLVLRAAWFVSLLFIFSYTILYVFILMFVMYFLLEFFSVILGAVISGHKSNLKYLPLGPVMVLFYRPYYAIVRSRAFLKWMLKKPTAW